MKTINLYFILLLIIAGVEKLHSQSLTIRTISFEKNSSGLGDKNKKIPDTIVARCKSGICSDLKILGYADKSGSAGNNLKISKERAYVVYNMLLSNLKIDSS